MLLALGMVLSMGGCAEKSAEKEEAAAPAETVVEEAASTEKYKHPLLNETLPMENTDEMGGADEAAGAYDHPDSKYFVNPDFYNMKNSDSVTILENFAASQQTNEYSCGANAILMSLNYLGIDKYSEYDISKAAHISTDEDSENPEPGTGNDWGEVGADVKKVVDFVNSIPELEVIETSYIENPTEDDLVSAEDVASLEYSPNMEGNLKKTFSAAALYTSDNDSASENWVSDARDSYFVKWVTNHLENNHPIIVHTFSWAGHYAVLIGYDDMGTPELGDDMLIFADSYDTSDHWQDGYTYFSLEEWFYTWSDMNVASKPYQLQPFVVVGAVE